MKAEHRNYHKLGDEPKKAYEWFIKQTGVSPWYAYLVGKNEIELHIWDYSSDWYSYFDELLKKLGTNLIDTGKTARGSCSDKFQVPIYEANTPNGKMKLTPVYKGFNEICTC